MDYMKKIFRTEVDLPSNTFVKEFLIKLMTTDKAKLIKKTAIYKCVNLFFS